MELSCLLGHDEGIAKIKIDDDTFDEEFSRKTRKKKKIYILFIYKNN